MSLAAAALQAGAVALGAALGALLRWQASLRLGFVVAGFPLGTLLVNVVGGFLIGLALVYAAAGTLNINSMDFRETGYTVSGGTLSFSGVSSSPITSPIGRG